MKRIILVLVLVIQCFSYITYCFADNDIALDDILLNEEYKHDWLKECEKNGCRFISNYAPPVPFDVWPIEASLDIEVYSKPPSNDLKAIMAQEIIGIKKTLSIVSEEIDTIPYLGKNRKPGKDGITFFVKKIKGKEIGFIRYRCNGKKDGPLTLPFLLTHAIILNSNEIILVHLKIFFALHQNEIEADQISILEKLIEKSSQ